MKCFLNLPFSSIKSFAILFYCTRNRFLIPLSQKYLARRFCNLPSLSDAKRGWRLRVSNPVRHVYYLWSYRVGGHYLHNHLNALNAEKNFSLAMTWTPSNVQSRHVPQEPHDNWGGILCCILHYLNMLTCGSCNEHILPSKCSVCARPYIAQWYGPTLWTF